MSVNSESGEEIIFALRTHPKVLFGPALGLIVILAAAIAASIYLPAFGWLTEWVEPGLLILICWGAALLAVLIFVLPAVLRWLSTHFIVTDRQIRIRQGVFTTRGTDVPLARVTDVEIERSLPDKIVGCGTLVIKNAGSQTGVVFDDVPGALAVREAIGELVYELNYGESSAAD